MESSGIYFILAVQVLNRRTFPELPAGTVSLFSWLVTWSGKAIGVDFLLGISALSLYLSW